MFSVNLVVTNDKLSCHVMQKHMIINLDIFPKEFEMDPSLSKLTVGSFPSFKKEFSIDLLFPCQTLMDVSRKFLIIGLSPKDRIIHFVICKV